MDWKSLLRLKSRDEIVSDALAELKARGSKVTDLNAGGVFRTLIELSAQGVADLYGLLEQVVPQGFVEYATGRWLDLHAQGLGLSRHPARRARGWCVFGRFQNGPNVIIPSGTIVQTDISPTGRVLRYFTEEPAVLAEGQLEVRAVVRAEFEGAAYNATPGYIRRLVTHVAGIDYVQNPEGWLIEEGTDAESDESLRQRLRSRWHEIATGATAAGYAAWARSVAGVLDVWVDDRFPRGPGTVDVVISSASGAPSPELIASVQAFLETKKPICDNVLVRGPDTVPVEIRLIVQVHPERGDLATIQGEVERRLQALFARNPQTGIEPLRIGEALVRARLVSIAMAIEHVVNVIVQAPAQDVLLSPSQLAVAGLIQVTVERVSW